MKVPLEPADAGKYAERAAAELLRRDGYDVVRADPRASVRERGCGALIEHLRARRYSPSDVHLPGARLAALAFCSACRKRCLVKLSLKLASAAARMGASAALPDFLASKGGRVVLVEVKEGGAALTPGQRKLLSWAARSGLDVRVVRATVQRELAVRLAAARFRPSRGTRGSRARACRTR